MFLLRVLALWLVLTTAELIHGVLRSLWLVPYAGDFHARQIGLFTGSILMLAIACLSIRWLRACTTAQLIIAGLAWLVLTVVFEFTFGRLVMGFSWERLASDYNLVRGGLLPIGLTVLALAPLIAAKVRGV